MGGNSSKIRKNEARISDLEQKRDFEEITETEDLALRLVERKVNEGFAVLPKDGAIRTMREIFDKVLLTYEDLQECDEIVRHIDTLFKSTPRNVRESISEIAHNCIDTVKTSKTLRKVERNRTEEMFVMAGDARMRVRTVYSFKYINYPKESRFWHTHSSGATNVAIAFKTKVEILQETEDGLNQQKFQAISGSGWI